MPELFLPDLNRRANYHKKINGEYYKDYLVYYDEISEDCIHRCIYCDIFIEEIGGEGMQLDHFRPQKKFPGKSNDPSNLVLSCPKCNRLKSDYWSCALDSKSTHNGCYGFVEPFEENRREFFSVEESGQFASLQGPANYMIDLLLLNRCSRVQVRRKRIMYQKANSLSDLVSEGMLNLSKKMTSGDIELEEAARQLVTLQEMHSQLQKILTI